MNNQLKNFLRILDALEKQKVQYVLVGGVAVILHGIKIKITTPETLYKLKKDSIRYKDKFDAAYLKDFIDIKQKEASEKGNPNKG
jgi:hypothetical protein